jgi:excisionase family DNA binding protein
MAKLQDLVETIWGNWRKIVDGKLGIESTTMELPDGNHVTVRRQFRLIRVLVDSETEGSFEIVVIDQMDMGGNPNSESLSIPMTKHRRTWNRIAAKTRKRATSTDFDKDSQPSGWNLYSRQSIALGKTSKQEELSCFLAVCFLRWGLCSSAQNDFLAEITQYVRRFKILNIRSVMEEYGSVDAFRSVVAQYIVYHLREPQHPHDINKYFKTVIAGLAHQARQAARQDFVWTEDEKGRGLAVERAAEYLSLTKQHLYEGIRSEKIEARRLTGNWLIPESELNRLQREQDNRREETEKRQAAIKYLIMKFHLKPETARKAVQRMESCRDDGESFREAFKRYISRKHSTSKALPKPRSSV